MIGSLGFTEVAFILILALLIFGPKRLPEMGRMLGKGMGEFRRASNELKRTFNVEMSLAEEEKKEPPKPQLASRQEPSATVSRQPAGPTVLAEEGQGDGRGSADREASADRGSSADQGARPPSAGGETAGPDSKSSPDSKKTPQAPDGEPS